VPGVEVAGVVDQHVDGTEAVHCRFDCCLGVVGVGDVELDGQQVVGVPDCLCDGVGVAAGRDDVVVRAGHEQIGRLEQGGYSARGCAVTTFRLRR
jgi:hypothetical protein